MRNILYVFFVGFCLCVACHNQHYDIGQLIKSDLANDRILASYKIGETRDTEFLPFLLDGLNDGRVSHHIRFKGISVYQSKVTALEKISGVKPPVPITYKPDSVIIKFYVELFKYRLNK